MLTDYYIAELKKVSGKNPVYPRTIQIKDNGNQTKWISLNDESAIELIKFLKENYNCTEES